MGAVLRLSRPHFLLGGALMFALGAATSGSWRPRDYLVGQAMVTASQLTAQLANEYADATVDLAVVNRTPFSGGSGVLQSGRLDRRVALRGALVTTLVCVALAAVMALTAPVAALIGVLSLVISWGYSVEPVRLLSTGWGEVVATLAVVCLVPLTGATALGASPTADLWWAIVVLAPVHLAMIVVFEVPDLESDAASGKRVLAVRLGERRTRLVVAGLLALTVVAGIAAATVGSLRGAPWAVVAGVLPAAAMVGAARRGRFAPMTVSAVATFTAVGIGLLVAIAG